MEIMEALDRLGNDGRDLMLEERGLEEVEEIKGRPQAELHRHPQVLPLHKAPIVLHTVRVFNHTDESDFFHHVFEFLHGGREGRVLLVAVSSLRSGRGGRGRGGRGRGTSLLVFPPKSIFFTATNSLVSLIIAYSWERAKEGQRVTKTTREEGEEGEREGRTL